MIRTKDSFAARLFESAPNLLAAAGFSAGALALIAAATPALPYIPGLAGIERALDEAPELTLSVIGVALMALSSGLRRRLDAAWAAATALLAALALYAFLRHDHHVAALAAAGAAALLIAARRAFYRRSRLADMLPDRRIALGIAAAMGLALVGAILWAGERPGFPEAPWWALLTDPQLGRAGRALALGALVFGVLAFNAFVLSRARGAPPAPSDSDFQRVQSLIAAAPHAPPDAELAFMGDKSFLFVEGGFVMAARSGSSLIAMHGPIGQPAARRAGLLALRAEAERLSLRPVVYAAPADLLPDLIDLGFRVEKIGENAVVDLNAFTLKGSARQNLRTARKRMVEREGGAFALRLPPHDPALMNDLRAISNAWLAQQNGGEKGFSLGAFDEAYLARHAIALVYRAEAPIAFASLWMNGARTRAAVDLMRFDPDRAPNGLMDFLFTETLLWAQREGFARFDLGMAPLAGLASDQYASLFARMGRLAAQLGEPIYGFEGLRAFKAKFGPDWAPRYLAAPGAFSLPIVLAEVALLTNAPPRRAAKAAPGAPALA